MKKCSKCGVEKPLDEFGNDRTKSTGKRADCKVCFRAYKNARNRDPEVKAKKQEYDRAYRAEYRQRPGFQERYQEWYQEWSQKPETLAQRRVREERRLKDPEQRAKKYAANQRRRARERSAMVDGYGEPLREVLIRFYDATCVYPGCDRTDATIDHIVALQNGGKHTYENTQPLCISHNSSKQDRHHTDYRLLANKGNGKEGIILTNIIGIAA